MTNPLSSTFLALLLSSPARGIDVGFCFSSSSIVRFIDFDACCSGLINRGIILGILGCAFEALVLLSCYPRWLSRCVLVRCCAS
jgi:hypothetical protein